MEKWLYSLLLTSVFASCVGLFAVKFQKGRLTAPVGREIPERAIALLRLALLLLFLPFPILNESLASLISLPWLWLVWAGGALTVLSLFLFSHGAEAKKARLRPVPKESDAAKLLSEMAKRVGVAPPPLWEGEVERPVMTLFRLVIPAEVTDEGKLLCYFCRLLVLRRRYSILFFYLWRGALILHWFNPLVRQMAKTDQLWSEEECDRMALWFLPDQWKPLYKDIFSKEKTRNLTFFMD
jgi:hypothetical protein